jgi:pimeloyl-ACP methyl ester carboxylesterase
MTERLVSAAGAELCVQTFGARTDPAVVMISGMGASMDWWEVDFCTRLAGAGRFVVRYDHRDTGRSTGYPPGEPGYTADELATDPLRVLDALGVERAHLVGVSMGGGIAQQLAAQHAERVATITLIATSPAGTRADPTPLPPPEPRLAATFAHPAATPDPADRAAVIDWIVQDYRPYAGTLGFDEQRVRRVAEVVADRSPDAVSRSANHSAAAEGSAPPFRLADIAVPTLVLHGSADPLFPLPHGQALATEIPGASLLVLDGMGHEVPPPQLWDTVLTEIVRHTDRARALA